MKRVLCLTLLAILAPLPALADPYVMFGAAAGTIDLGDIKNGFYSNPSVSDSTSRVIAGIGGRVNRNLGVEVNYLSKSSNSVNQGSYRDNYSHDGFQVGLLGFMPVARNVDLFAKVTANYLNTSYNTNNTVPASYYSEDHSDTHFGFGGGAEFNIAQNIALRAQVEQIMIRSTISPSFLNGASGDFNVTQGSVALLMYFK